MDPARNATAAPPRTHDARELLREDHRRLQQLCEEYASLVEGDASAADCSGLLARIGGRLRIHARIEDEIFYPALPAGETLTQARAEHERLDRQLRRLTESAQADGGVAALAEALRRHAAFEEERLFPLAEGLDLAELGKRLRARRVELTGDYDQPS
ncbi:hemerythrin domain-containing protein [Rubrivivax gelatinosus]|uniref:Hemerythrin-like domain-containing protein n=1 Tax=Rubrivivax gelatinosus (strain NBRC 100245 / IL144) TaxID=983917 RepID=I0HS69_RUBGI|nr:hemerythrin domain-containing protein [Rubrivivax gelatinosus]BAL95856.1 hypothetical protein RGE_25150 [Rubrivivax gelatinosus IL144]